ncbi:MAG TPA: ATP synthase F0 subunit B [Bryobacteraceae bacterium]|nr:ATP synthase F0 subunit B [Bryobacteraceae bacterium]
MRRGLRFALLVTVTVCFGVAFAQEGEAGKKPESFAERHELALKWANFLLLAGGLAYLIKKNGGPFLAERSRKIQEDIREADAVRQDAERRAAEVDRRLATLETEIAGLRAESENEAAAETERMRRQTAAEIAKVQAHAEQEIVAAGKTARAELKQYAAELAIGLAEKKLEARMTADTQDALVRGFVRDVDSLSSTNGSAQH